MQTHSVALTLILAFTVLLTPWFPQEVLSAERTVIGSVESVLLLPWRVPLLARIDTGAARTSLGAQELKISGEFAEFRLGNSGGGRLLRLRILRWRKYKTSEGSDRRPIVEIELCVGRQQISTHANLNDRGHLKYPLLLGRRLLAQGKFLVDVTRSQILKPDCGKTDEDSPAPDSTPFKP